jgi:hypothetical protein
MTEQPSEFTLTPAQGFAAAVAAEAAEDVAATGDLAARLIEVQVELGKVQRSAAASAKRAASERKRRVAMVNAVCKLHFRSFLNQNRCGHCGHTWPCPTITALDQP